MLKYEQNIKNPNSLDKSLIQTLGKDATLSSEKVARKLKVSAATVRRRTRKLVNDGTLRIIGVVAPSKVGLQITALIALDLPQENVDRVSNQLAKYPEVKWLSTTTGQFNIMVFVRTSCTDGLAVFMEKTLPKCEGIRGTKLTVCLNVKKGHYVQV